MSLSRAPARDTYETPSPRERIRSHMKMVIAQLDGILKELKDVAKELREPAPSPSHVCPVPRLAPLSLPKHCTRTGREVQGQSIQHSPSLAGPAKLTRMQQ
ncbi:hypothetical protein NHX12_005498 [Muraenolepis orangiensis]|uniref:Uncharacterized protein n=1 Tax=Muraenolepis orangiensis TaxID=630683 RepID=A0A9Q0DV50_9TELE|nr:hypothetical protein NHX12_005498 [Muraenolepis orangiensis]